jgi:hypothetical protein
MILIAEMKLDQKIKKKLLLKCYDIDKRVTLTVNCLQPSSKGYFNKRIYVNYRETEIRHCVTWPMELSFCILCQSE